MSYRRALWLVAIFFALLSIAGCAGPFGFTGMNAEQIKEWAKIKDANVTCVRGVYAGGIVTVISISVDKAVPAGVTVDADCKASLLAQPTEQRP